MRWMDGPDMVEHLCETLRSQALDAALLASICARAFQTRAYRDVDAATGQEGVRIETGMEDFVCQQCGQCCVSLDYHNEATAEDVARWEAQGRQDILKWVGVCKGPDENRSYRIWTIPGMSELADTCPFLEHRSWENRWVCLIHDAKPGICRQYPATRKHAEMTGCPGFKSGLSWKIRK
jgi:Fe-S-cluster containining protein